MNIQQRLSPEKPLANQTEKANRRPLILLVPQGLRAIGWIRQFPLESRAGRPIQRSLRNWRSLLFPRPSDQPAC